MHRRYNLQDSQHGVGIGTYQGGGEATGTTASPVSPRASSPPERQGLGWSTSRGRAARVGACLPETAGPPCWAAWTSPLPAAAAGGVGVGPRSPERGPA